MQFFASLSVRVVTRLQAFTTQTVQKLALFRCLDEVSLKVELYRSKLLTEFLSGQKLTHFAVKKLARFCGSPCAERWIRTSFSPFKNSFRRLLIVSGKRWTGPLFFTKLKS